jgi:hypothetical protein
MQLEGKQSADPHPIHTQLLLRWPIPPPDNGAQTFAQSENITKWEMCHWDKLNLKYEASVLDAWCYKRHLLHSRWIENSMEPISHFTFEKKTPAGQKGFYVHKLS